LQVGFIILSHKEPHQTIRLIRRLQNLYDNPPIVCHHDFGQSPIAADKFPSDVKLVLPYIKTAWANYSVITAFLAALKLLQTPEPTPDWFVLLSGADYPTLSADKVVAELSSSGVDAFSTFEEIPLLSRAKVPPNLQLPWDYYIRFRAWIPILRKGARVGRYTISPPIKQWASPFDAEFKCFKGSHWFAGTRKVAAILMHPTLKHVHLQRHLKWRHLPEECYYQSILGNYLGLKISQEKRRFANWRGGGAHPKILGMEDLPEILASKSHFARKFDKDTAILDELDRLVV